MLISPEERLLSVYNSGIYITNRDLVILGKELGIDLPLKTREYLFGEIIYHVKTNGYKDLFLEKLQDLIDSKVADYKALEKNYEKAAPLISSWREKALSLPEDFQRYFND